MQRNTAVVAGATGLVGHYLLNVLAEDSFYDQVLALSRRPVAALAPRIRNVLVDYEDLTPDDLPGATHLFCCLGTTIKKAGSGEAFRRVDFEYVRNFAEAGHLAGARRLLLVSSVSAASSAGSSYLRVKAETEQAVSAMEWDSLYLFRPSVLLGKRAEERPAEQLAGRLARAFEFALAGPLRKYRPMPAGLLASAMAAAGERGPRGRHVFHYDDILEIAGFSGKG
jgi:uncharacterized protein YbjT (DUF2867 family)